MKIVKGKGIFAEKGKLCDFCWEKNESPFSPLCTRCRYDIKRKKMNEYSNKRLKQLKK